MIHYILSLVVLFSAGITWAQQPSPAEVSPQIQNQPQPPNLRDIRRSYNPLVFSEGYVLGHVDKASVEGTVWEGFEGEILLGLNSVPGGVVEDECVNKKVKELQQGEKKQGKPSPVRPQVREQAIDQCIARINPFPISSYATGWQDLLNQFRSTVDLSLIRYKGYWVHPLLGSPYFIKEVIPVKNYPLPVKSLDQMYRFPVYRTLHYGTSQVEGRAVIASMDGIIRKHYHLIMQSGVGGGKFVHIEVPTQILYDYIVRCMSAGKLIRVYYFILYEPQAYPSNMLLGYGTNLRAYRVDVIDN